MFRDVSVSSGRRKFIQNIRIGPHTFEADEPSEQGGNDAGSDPHELLLAALGACASITVCMYAERKQWSVEGVHVHLSYARVPVGNQSGATPALVDGIQMDISFSGDLSDEQRRRLLEIAERCPVHRLLTSQVEIRSNLRIHSGSRVGADVSIVEPPNADQ